MLEVTCPDLTKQLPTPEVLAVGLALRYLEKMLLSEATVPFMTFKPYNYYTLSKSQHPLLDGTTIANLDLFDSSSSLCSLLDTTVTPFGSRLLRKWICFPFQASDSNQAAVAAMITDRQQCVTDLLAVLSDVG
jgi:DNA mismatch repair protein MSH6